MKNPKKQQRNEKEKNAHLQHALRKEKKMLHPHQLLVTVQAH